MAAHSAAASIQPVPPDQPPEGYATWLREIAAAVNLIGSQINNRAGLPDAADDAAAAALGVPVGGAYRAGSVLMVRVV
jgi:hypothetical protein